MTNPNIRQDELDSTGENVRPVAKPLMGAISLEIAAEMIDELAPMEVPHHHGAFRPPIVGGIL